MGSKSSSLSKVSWFSKVVLFCDNKKMNSEINACRNAERIENKPVSIAIFQVIYVVGMLSCAKNALYENRVIGGLFAIFAPRYMETAL